MLRRLKCNPPLLAVRWKLGDQTRLCEGVNPLQLTIDLATELERVQAWAKFDEGGEWGGLYRLVCLLSLQPIQRCAGEIVAAAQLRAHAHFLHQLGRRLKEIEPQAQFMAIEVIHGFHRLRGVVAIPAHQLANMRPVLLLDVGVVVLLVGAAVAELHLVVSAPTADVPVDKFRAIVGIDPPQREGQRRLDLLQSVQHRLAALAQYGSRLGPARVHIGQVERVGELPAGGVSRMRNQIHLRETRQLLLPVVGAEGDQVFEQRARLAAPGPP